MLIHSVTHPDPNVFIRATTNLQFLAELQGKSYVVVKDGRLQNDPSWWGIAAQVDKLRVVLEEAFTVGVSEDANMQAIYKAAHGKLLILVSTYREYKRDDIADAVQAVYDNHSLDAQPELREMKRLGATYAAPSPREIRRRKEEDRLKQIEVTLHELRKLERGVEFGDALAAIESALSVQTPEEFEQKKEGIRTAVAKVPDAPPAPSAQDKIQPVCLITADLLKDVSLKPTEERGVVPLDATRAIRTIGDLIMNDPKVAELLQARRAQLEESSSEFDFEEEFI